MSALVTNQKKFSQGLENGQKKVENATYWYKQSIDSYKDSAAHNYINPKIDQIDYIGLTELDVGQVLHGNQWQQKIQGRPLLAMLGEETTFMGDVSDYGKGLNAVMPRLKRSWYESYQAYGEAASGYATWPVGSGATSFSKSQEQEADDNIVKQVALDMEKDKNYWENQDVNASISASENDVNVDEDDDSEIENNSENSQGKGHYVINMTETFAHNSGISKIHNGNEWVGYSPLLGITTGATVNVKGWDILRLLY